MLFVRVDVEVSNIGGLSVLQSVYICARGRNLIGSLSKHDVDSSDNFSIIQSHFVCKMCSNHRGIILGPVLQG